jgi:hypothetical protein
MNQGKKITADDLRKAKTFDDIEELFFQMGAIRGPTNYSRVFPCPQGKVTLRFSADYASVRSIVGPQETFKRLWEFGPQILLNITKKVLLLLKPTNMAERQMSARFSPEECIAFLDGEWPGETNLSRIARAIREKNHYPMPEPEIPGGGGKAMTAQGQTKKPDAHSHKKHH